MRFRLILALASGLALWLAFPSHNQWLLAPVGVGLLALATRDVPARWGLLLGLVAGLACFVPVLSWSGVYVGTTPWLALAVLESLYIALVGWASALLQRAPSLAGAPRVRPLVIALLWVAQEALRGRTPFGGFPWARLAFSQADSPLVHLAALGGAPAVTFGVALTGAVAAAAVSRLGWSGPGRGVTVREGGRPVTGLGRAVPVLVLAGALLLAPLLVPTPTDGQQARFMAVQGNVPRAGLEFNAERRAVLDNHAAVTRAAAASVAAGTPAATRPRGLAGELLRHRPAAQRRRRRRDQHRRHRRRRARVVVGAVLEGPGPSTSPTSACCTGPGSARPRPSATSSSTRCRSPSTSRSGPSSGSFSDKVDLVRADIVAGRASAVFRVPARPAGWSRPAPVICFEVAYDDLCATPCGPAPTSCVVQTNNATFGYTDESEQQLAMSRVRAVEHGRSIVHVSTVGVSALITPDGTAHQRTALFTSALLAGDLPLRTAATVADRVGGWPEYLACSAVLLMLLRRGIPRRRR